MAVGGLPRAALDNELAKGVASARAGRLIAADEVDAEFEGDFGV